MVRSREQTDPKKPQPFEDGAIARQRFGHEIEAIRLDEFVFRFNRRDNPEAAFQTLLGLGSVHAPVRRATIEGGWICPTSTEISALG